VDNENITIKITDQGMGIPMADQIHLFERFFRATNATNIQGTGLGLHIVGRYIEILSGTISYESELEKGSTFKIVLPSIKKNDLD
jgi:signal transduction histidine kinase